MTEDAGQQAQDDAVDRWVHRWMQERHIPGLSLAVVKGGRVVKTRAYGLASIELEVPASTTTVYALAPGTAVWR